MERGFHALENEQWDYAVSIDTSSGREQVGASFASRESIFFIVLKVCSVG
jgi:hypothetical protein